MTVRFVCDLCWGDGWVQVPTLDFEPDYRPCPLCKGDGVRVKVITPDVEPEDAEQFGIEYDPFGGE